MITVAMLAALGHHEELRAHLAGALSVGLSRDELVEVLMQVAVVRRRARGRGRAPRRRRRATDRRVTHYTTNLRQLNSYTPFVDAVRV